MNGHNLPLATVKIQCFEQHSVRYKSTLFGTKVLTNSYRLSCQNHQGVKGGKKMVLETHRCTSLHIMFSGSLTE